ncbi:MAG: M23 family metallopeptidase [Gemmatimonadales bacterium]|nr:MAG: M23 family metallopeptidase [Gemmatimonadales bacterium]
MTWPGEVAVTEGPEDPEAPEAAGGGPPEEAAVVRVALPGSDGEPGREMEWRLPLSRLRRYVAVGIVFVVAASVLIGSWVFLAARSAGVRGMQEQIAILEQEREQVRELAATLEAAEESYQRLRDLFLPEGGVAGPLWLPPAGAGPPPGSGAARQGPESDDDASFVPEIWPLTERGFLTRGLIMPEEGASDQGAHPGIDVAIPSGSYFRAVGRGRVVERGEDPVYGLFLVVEHPGGYRSLYAHASVITAEPGRTVGAGEVLGMTGSSGRSTAPHLHLEITRDGRQVDPLTYLRRP